MKKLLIVFACLLTMQATASDDKPITFEQLPAPSQQFIKTYFPEQSIALVKMDSEILDKSYEVIFTNGAKVEFDKRGDWKEVDCKRAACPEGIIPVQIRDYAAQNYPNIGICKIEKENRNGYEIGLTNGVSLEFDSNFKLIDIDD